MQIFYDHNSLQSFIKSQRERNATIGFAPTMGALHDGHLSLYAKARQENDIVVASIFINPTQFDNVKDLQKYPRNFDKDIQILENSSLVDAVYIPSDKDIYPEVMERKKYDFGGIEKEMEGEFREGHFDGVGTVVEKLFLQVQPNTAYFGEKDYQQLAIVEQLVEIRDLPVKIIGVPIFREKNGLAMSSRNVRLSETQRESAKIIYETLLMIEEWFRVITIPEIIERVSKIFEDEEGMVLEYFKIADEKTLKETDFFYKDKNYRAFIVVFVDDVRLIDNIHLS
ncbi:pantoate--beta-alanine ligase [Frigoriflavimonas asaccharolytica]|uniref:Pantothenate synthetase n=1 Tax=Frigoriflavimonas asaccharolytica TaxID=2735899 RepID=A0A8J8K8U4_9FLAO|nr:pantoate--beta-alanine ligase [Frigoriflavimonas asaccharolytica]NRS92327.1 pantoate--beta-alanine ligase [Frigoriflavimonas asaccharolytica]